MHTALGECISVHSSESKSFANMYVCALKLLQPSTHNVPLYFYQESCQSLPKHAEINKMGVFIWCLRMGASHLLLWNYSWKATHNTWSRLVGIIWCICVPQSWCFSSLSCSMFPNGTAFMTWLLPPSTSTVFLICMKNIGNIRCITNTYTNTNSLNSVSSHTASLNLLQSEI